MALAALSLPAQNTVKLTASKANDFGIAYSLPITEFDIVIETQLTERQPGELANYANRLLNISDAITQPSYSASVKSVTVVPRGIPNEDNRWLMEFKGQGVTYMLLNDAGVPVAINTEEVTARPYPALPVAQKAQPTALESPALNQAMTQEIISTTSQSKRAQLIAQRVFELREKRNDLISGNADNTPPDGKSMQLMLDNLAAQEAALTALFAGTEKSWTTVETLTYRPDKEVSNMVLARVSPLKGLVSDTDLSGKPIYLSMQVIATGEIPNDANGAPKKPVKDGLAYTIPGTVQLTLTYDGGTLMSQDYEVAQFGKTFYLDPKIFNDKKVPTYVTFDPVTGGILSIGTK